MFNKYLPFSEFELEYLLLEGHAWDNTLGTPPRGLQLVLGTKDNPEAKDTIVMANLGYFQLKANPGAWILRLRPGRSEEIYEIVGYNIQTLFIHYLNCKMYRDK